MHGFVMNQLQQFVQSTANRSTWYAILEKAELPDAQFHAVADYPDEQMTALVGAASDVMSMAADDILESFGAFLGEALFTTYRPIIDPELRTIEFLEHVEDSMHKAVRARNSQAHPPVLDIKRTGADEVTIGYTSQRRLCSVARGMARGIAEHYGEPVTINEDSCMKHGDDQCLIRVTRQT